MGPFLIWSCLPACLALSLTSLPSHTAVTRQACVLSLEHACGPRTKGLCSFRSGLDVSSSWRFPLACLPVRACPLCSLTPCSFTSCSCEAALLPFADGKPRPRGLAAAELGFDP